MLVLPASADAQQAKKTDREKQYQRIIKECSPKGVYWQNIACDCHARSIETVMPFKSYNEYIDRAKAGKIEDAQAEDFLARMKSSRGSFRDCIQESAIIEALGIDLDGHPAYRAAEQKAKSLGY